MAATDNIRYRKLYLIISVVSSLGILFIFKYLNFFAWTTMYFLGYSQAERAAPLRRELLLELAHRGAFGRDPSALYASGEVRFLVAIQYRHIHRNEVCHI